ncbi:MAG: O-antigen ligase family protein [Peptococcaceae bacterium]|nr:O-antigen ligase family protein [Peptococcaceae bacterium]
MLKLQTIEKSFVIISLFLLSGALLPLWRQMSGFNIDLVEGDPLQQGIFAAIYSVSFLFLLLRPRRTLDYLRTGIYLWPLFGWVLLSFFWSQAFDVTVRREIALLGTTIFGLYLASRFEHHEFLRLLGWTLLVAVVLSYVFILLMPDWGLVKEFRWVAWRGIYITKNVLARVNVLASLVFALLATSKLQNKFVWWSGFILAVVLVIGSHSVTAFLVLISLVFFVLFIKVLRWRFNIIMSLLFPFFIAAGAFTWLVINNVETILAFLGRESTLTGRTILWNAAIYMAKQHPWLGYGYGAFWLGDGPSDTIWQIIGWETPHSHNGFIDLWLMTGLIGVGLFIFCYIHTFCQSIKQLRMSGNKLNIGPVYWPVYYLMFVILYNITESNIILQNSIYWLLFVVVVFKVAKN